ncbi:MAG: 30S ribosomal protein S20 [Bdellovibrionales bacterium]|nr:30S ribosomal protein S20 [Bdellovibrionales bacterium]
MANHQSAIKRIRQNETRNERNRWWKSRIKAVVKSVVAAIDKKDSKAAQESLKAAMTELHKAAGKGVLHKSTASRKISRLSKAVSSIS